MLIDWVGPVGPVRPSNSVNKYIYICYLPGRRSVWEKTVHEVLSSARRPRAVLKTKGTVFSGRLLFKVEKEIGIKDKAYVA